MAVWRFICCVARWIVRICGAIKRGALFVSELVVHIARRLTGQLGSDRGRRRIHAAQNRTGSLLSVGAVLLLLGAIGFSVYQVARHMTVGLGTLRTQEIVDETYISLDLYLFRDEAVLMATGSEITHYAVRDGEKVGVGSYLGTAYAVGSHAPVNSATGQAMTPSELQALLNAYGARIALFHELGGLGTPADARAEAEAVDRNYLGLLDAAQAGNLAAVGGFGEGMLDGIGRYDILTGNMAGTGTLASIKAEEAALLAELTAVATVKTERGGYFYYEADGYESVFPYSAAMTMTPGEFRAMTTESSVRVPDGVVGKMVYSPTWYAATYIPLDSADSENDRAIELFQQGIATGRSYRMICGDSAGEVVTMKIERLVPDSDGVLLVFSSQEMPDGFDFSRTLQVETVAHAVSGYRIPTEALVTLPSEETEDGVIGVYVLAGNVVEFRKVRIRVQREEDGYVIAETYEEVRALLDSYTDEEYAAVTADGWSYLRLNDNIIISGNELYEGKIIS